MIDGHHLEKINETFDHRYVPYCECGWVGVSERSESAAADSWHDHAASFEPSFQELREWVWSQRRADGHV